MKPLAACRLYGFVDSAYGQGRDPIELTKMLCDGGADLIQYRAKEDTSEQILRTAESLLPVTQAYGVGLVINDHPKIALRLGAECCHMGQEDFFDAGYRLAAQVTGCPPEIKLGLSTHAPEQAQRALRAEPDYIAIGPVYATGTKPSARPVTLDYVRWASRHVTIPWFAIGGITLDNLEQVLQAGATRVCVVSAILNQADVAGACQAFKKRLVSMA